MKRQLAQCQSTTNTGHIGCQFPGLDAVRFVIRRGVNSKWPGGIAGARVHRVEQWEPKGESYDEALRVGNGGDQEP
jgi:hypothetical protein